MNIQLKLCNDILVATARALDEVLTAACLEGVTLDVSNYEMILMEASELLATIKPEDRGGNTWKYEGEICEGDECKLKL